MGIPVPPDRPDYGECPDCCETLPSSLSCKFTVPEMEPFTGTLENTPEDPCSFSGLLSDGVNGDVPVFLVFCDNGGTTRIIAGGALGVQCGGCAVDDNHCNPYISCTSPGECDYQVGT